MTQQQLKDAITGYLGPIIDAADKLNSRTQRSQFDPTLMERLDAALKAARAAGKLDALPARTSEMSNSDTRLDPSTNWATLVNA